jgi:hypothetical protein
MKEENLNDKKSRTKTKSKFILSNKINEKESKTPEE